MQDGSSTNTRPANKWSKEKGLIMINVHTWTNILTLKNMLKGELHFESKKKIMQRHGGEKKFAPDNDPLYMSFSECP